MTDVWSTSIYEPFSLADADFRKQSQMLACLDEAKIQTVNFTALLGQNHEQFVSECQTIIGQMLDNSLYDISRRFAKVCGVTADHVTVKQVCI